MTNADALQGVEIAWVGLGRMGSAMASRLLASGVDLAVWNRTPERADALVARGARRLRSLGEAGACDVVFSMVLDDAALDSLHDGESGLFGAAHPGAGSARVWIDGSTVSPAASERAARAAAEAGAAFVAAPISGNPAVVEAGQAIFAISGDDAGLEVAEAIGLAIGRAVHRVGSRTEASVIKLCVNALLSVTMQSLAEVAVLADRAGVSRALLMEFLNDSAIGSPFTRYKTAPVVTLDFPPAFTPEGQRKDVRLALELARALEVPLPVLATTEVAYSSLVSGGLGEGKDFAALILEVARDAGHQLRPEELR
ncbi:NAD(P)-dependent oxidoreductase [Herbiconiux sp. A18JL235]|uniref:NAD(P)-dependent oxidoreductase n=1 Tax=Herbiconiux sp. A18JL235 TaxID=3152363 RepID=A0AB39BIQ5_9MICO